MNRELSWPDRQGPQQAPLQDLRRVGPSLVLPADIEAPYGSLKHAYALEQRDDDRRISTAGAFFMFMFGFGCGAFWTLALLWFF